MESPKPKQTIRQFMSKNVVAVVMVPALFGLHYMWYKMQSMEELVRPEEKKRLQLEQVS